MNLNFCKLLSTLRLLKIMIIAITIMTGSFFIDAFTSITSAQTDEDSRAVLAQVINYQNVWNTHNAAALTEFFTNDADFIMGNQPLISGRKAIQNWWQNYFNRQESDRKLTIDINSFRIIATGVTLINIGTTTGGKDNDGNEFLARKARGTWVLLNQNGNWLISAMRGMPTEEDQIIRSIGN